MERTTYELASGEAEKREKRRRQERKVFQTQKKWKMVVPRFRFGLYTLSIYIYIYRRGFYV